jgi:hypothetical protein
MVVVEDRAAVESSHSESVIARWTGWSLLGLVLSLLVAHGGAMAIAGDRATGILDVPAITQYYSHAGLGVLYWQHGLGIVLFGAFVAGFWLLDKDRVTKPVDAVLLGAGVVAAAAVVPLGLTELGLQAAMAKLAGASQPDALLAVFVSWDWIYNSLFYWLEVMWVGAFSLVMLRAGLFPRWLGVWGLVVAATHVFHSSVLLTGMPDAITLPGSALFLVWLITIGVKLVRWQR